MKLNCYFLVLSVCLLAGCRTEKETIQFSCEMSPPHRRPAEAPALPAPSLNPQDLFAQEQLRILPDLALREKAAQDVQWRISDFKMGIGPFFNFAAWGIKNDELLAALQSSFDLLGAEAQKKYRDELESLSLIHI